MSFLTCRKKAGLSQAEVAQKLGVTDASVCQWETGKTFPDARKLPYIAELYKCTIDDLLKSSTEDK